MRPVLWGHLRRTPGRALALVLGVALAGAAFTVLSGTVRTSRLQVLGTVRAHSRGVYDLLVRPAGSRTASEREQGQVRGDFLSGIFGGITVDQYRKIAATPGVEVAAPVEMLGYVIPRVYIFLDETALLGKTGRALVRVGVTWVSDRGSTRIRVPSYYAYVTPNELAGPTVVDTPSQVHDTETAPDGKTTPVCQEPTTLSPYRDPFVFVCYSRQQPGPDGSPTAYPGIPPGHRSVFLTVATPFLVAAVDPVAEARLAHLDRAVTSGRYLRASDTFGATGHARLPVLLSRQPTSDLHAEITQQRMSAGVLAAAARGASAPALDRLPGGAGPVSTRTISAGQAYGKFLAAATDPNAPIPAVLSAYWTGSPVRYADAKGPLRPLAVRNPDSTWASQYSGYLTLPQTVEDDQYRKLTQYVPNTDVGGDPTPVLTAVGTFDPNRLPGYDNLAAVPLGTYYNPNLASADAASTKALHGQPLAPDGSPAGYLQQPPLMLTTLAGAEGFFGSAFPDRDGSAPISSIRIRVKGVTGVDPVSRERVRLAAQALARTGLDVDVTAGSSPTLRTVALPAGRFGRPALTLHENWVKKGVAVAILRAADRKSLALLTLVLLVCAIFVANAAAASVRTRRTELGVLACLGWRPARLTGLVAAELVVLGGTAGVASMLAAVPLAAGLGYPVGWGRAALAVPGSVALALLAGLVPAVFAGRAAPLEAARPAGRPPRRAGAANSVAGLALVGVRRRPGRSALAGSGLVVAVAAFTVLLAVTAAFHGAVVGSLLGGAVAVQVRGVDYAAAAATLALAALGVADVLYISLHERAAEFATLRAAGWPERALARLLVTEGVIVGVAGSAVGALLGLAGVLTLAHLTLPVAAGALAAAALGITAATAASLASLTALRRLSTVELLSSD